MRHMVVWVRAVLGQPVEFCQIWELALEPVCKMAHPLDPAPQVWGEAQQGDLHQLLAKAASVL
ncbi:hypothetical protein WL1483_4252 [Aeromonas schubertii]|uniref:Uncharacterized protein n=1 Tax=Aeromonas schubertii TaxID=652 RepID=A0A0S2SPR5_9GAMM|nr:hypothetical protein WL1483_4252 [Aeromonas schubertii]